MTRRARCHSLNPTSVECPLCPPPRDDRAQSAPPPPHPARSPQERVTRPGPLCRYHPYDQRLASLAFQALSPRSSFSLCFPCSFLRLPIASSIVSTLECLVLSITIAAIASSIRCLVPSRANLQFCVVVEAFKLLVSNTKRVWNSWFERFGLKFVLT